MKRFLLFGFDTYYPCGGMEDFFGDFDTLDEAKKFPPRHGRNNYQIFDTQDKVCHMRSEINWSSEYTDWQEESLDSVCSYNR